jgi:hypothetical protein
MSMLFGGTLCILLIIFSEWNKRKDPEIKGLGLGGIIATICILIHSLTDFNLHIPANVLLFSVVISLTAVVVFYKRPKATSYKNI